MMLNSHLLLLRSPYCFSQTCFPNVSPRCSELITNIYGIFVIPNKIKSTIHTKSSATDGFLAGCSDKLGAFTRAILSKGGCSHPTEKNVFSFSIISHLQAVKIALNNEREFILCMGYTTHTHTHTIDLLCVFRLFDCTEETLRERNIRRLLAILPLLFCITTKQNAINNSMQKYYIKWVM